MATTFKDLVNDLLANDQLTVANHRRVKGIARSCDIDGTEPRRGSEVPLTAVEAFGRLDLQDVEWLLKMRHEQQHKPSLVRGN